MKGEICGFFHYPNLKFFVISNYELRYIKMYNLTLFFFSVTQLEYVCVSFFTLLITELS